MGAPVICFVHGRQQLCPGPFPTNAMISDCLTSTTTDFDARQQPWLLFIHPLSGSSTHVSFGGVHACLHCAHSTCNLAAETINNRPLHYITYHFVRTCCMVRHLAVVLSRESMLPAQLPFVDSALTLSDKT